MDISHHSDLHDERIEALKRELFVSVKADVIVLAGDIDRIEVMAEYLKEISLAHPLAHIIFVPGNHEFYFGADMLWSISKLKRDIARNEKIHVLYRDQVIIDGVRFLGATLWSDFSGIKTSSQEKNRLLTLINQSVADFMRITLDGRNFTVQDCISQGEMDVKWLTNRLSEPFDGKTVVITHFCPSLAGRNMKYPIGRLTHYFCLDQDDLIKRYAPNLWISGHTHHNISKMIGKTRLVSNQKGYDYEDLDGYDIKRITTV